MNQAQRVLEEVKESAAPWRFPLESLAESLETMMGRVQQVMKQTKVRNVLLTVTMLGTNNGSIWIGVAR